MSGNRAGGSYAHHGDQVARMQEAAPALLAYFLRRVDIPADAADLVSETFATAWTSIERMPRDDEAGRMWLFGVARNSLRHHYRAGSRRDALTLKLRQLIDSEAHGGTNTEDSLSDELAVRAALRKLPEELAELIRLVYWDGFSLEQAATHLEIPASTARGQHARAKTMLRAVLERESVHPG